MRYNLKSESVNLAYASCIITGDLIDHYLWSKYFNTTPDQIIIKGLEFITPSGRMSNVPGRVGIWYYSTKNRVDSDDLDPHIHYLISQLGLPRSDLSNLLQDRNLEMKILCYWNNYIGNRIPIVSKAMKSAIKKSGGLIEIDEYSEDAPQGRISRV